MEENALTLTLTLAALQQYGEAVAALYKAKLLTPNAKGYNHRASGGLVDSIRAQVTSPGEGTFEVSLTLQDYWKYVEHGRRPGKWPPRSAILNWIRIKPVIPYPDKNGRLPSEQSLAFLISRKIGTKGIDPSNDLAKTLEELNTAWLPKIEQAFADDVAGAIGEWITLTPDPV